MSNAEVDFSLMEGILNNPFFLWFYVIGVISTVFHLANGLWGFAVTWGITQSPRSQQVVTYLTLLVLVVVSYIGVRAIFAFVSLRIRSEEHASELQSRGHLVC